MNHDDQQIEIHLEELGQHSWVKALLNTASGTYGSAQYRFVARGVGDDDGTNHVAVSATFPHLRLSDLDEGDPTGRDPWLPIAQQRLEELDARLAALGWNRTSEVVPHWWSRHYVRRDPGGGHPTPDTTASSGVGRVS